MILAQIPRNISSNFLDICQKQCNFVGEMLSALSKNPVTIGEDCWLGGGVIVCPGVTIGDRCIIAAGSVVTHDIPCDTMAAGVPAEVKKSLK